MLTRLYLPGLTGLRCRHKASVALTHSSGPKAVVTRPTQLSNSGGLWTAHLRKAADCASRRANSRGLPRTRHRLTGRCGGHQERRAAARQSLWASQSLARAGHRTESLSCNLPMSCWTQLVTRFDVKVIPHHALRVSL